MYKTKKRRKISVILIVIFIFLTLFLYYIKLVNPIIKDYSKAKVNALTEELLNEAVSNVVNTTLNYDKIVNISYTNNGNISYINANQYIINVITREVVNNAQQLMQKIGSKGIGIPIGTFTGISIFVGRGPDLKLEMLPIAIVGSKFNSKFTNMGINNTLHQLYLDVTTRVELILPIKKQVIEVTQSVLLCEGIIIGEVPEVYLGNMSLNKNYDLVP